VGVATGDDSRGAIRLKGFVETSAARTNDDRIPETAHAR
jgi:hypothetical protein